MDLRSRRNDSDVRLRPRVLTAKRGHLLGCAVGITVAIAACGQAATGLQGTDANAPGSAATASGPSGTGAHAGGSKSAASEPSPGSAGPGQGGGPTSTSTPGSTSPGASSMPSHGPTATARPAVPTPGPPPPAGTRNKLLW